MHVCDRVTATLATVSARTNTYCLAFLLLLVVSLGSTMLAQRSLKMVAMFAENVCSILAAMLAKIAALD